jgi:serine/threonine-protein phosphatase 2B catalytic subunit
MRSMDSRMRALRSLFLLPRLTVSRRRKSDIENERLPPELFDAESEEGKALISSSSIPSTPAEQSVDASSAVSAANLEAAILQGPALAQQNGGPLSLNTSVGGATGSPVSGSPGPGSPTTPGGSFRRGHARQASLGTTMTSPSTRRRSLESTMSLIQGVWDGQTPNGGGSIAEEGPQPGGDGVDGLAGQLAGSSVNGAKA